MEMFNTRSVYRGKLYITYMTIDIYHTMMEIIIHIFFSPYPSRNHEAIVLFHVGTRAWTCENVSHGVHCDYYHTPYIKGLKALQV